MNKKIFLVIAAIGIIVSGFLFSFRLTQTPSGLTIDEASIGYNAVLLSRNLHDESGRFLPFFPLTINGHDWKQPITVYSTAIIFKIFGPSLTNLKLVSVVAGLVSLVLVVFLSTHLLGYTGGLVSGLLFISAPIVVMHTHLAQENIMPIPFTLFWLTGLYLFPKKNNYWFLILSGVSLGLGLYSYKGMRAIVPVWAILTVIYLFLSATKKIDKKSLSVSIKNCLFFALGISPFLLIIPWLNTHYAGAVFESSNLEIKTFYTFLYPYLPSFDVSALFIKGDSTPWHSTGMHGVFLLSTLPLFVIGLVSALKKEKYWLFLLSAFFTAPLLFGQVGSVYRFSRLLVFVPFFVLLSTLGVAVSAKSKRGKYLLPVISLFVIINFFDFAQYYWNQYPQIEKASFLTNSEKSFQQLAKVSQDKNLKPYIYIDDFVSEGEAGKFFESANFPEGLGRWKPGDILPPRSVVMTRLKAQPNMTNLNNTDVAGYYLLIN